MCGILGAYKKDVSKEVFEKALSSIAHRGPNAWAIYQKVEAGLSLGHRRLSIIDLSEAGIQPMWSNDGRYAIIFNGEVYNYLELKKEFDQYQFRTKTDTEVVLAAYEILGVKCLEKFNGMFAFAIWDEKDQSLFIARDRLGVKPLFYTQQNGSFLFSSEIKGLLSLGVSAEVNQRIVSEYLAYGLYDHTEETFFKGINVLLPGHYALVNKGGLEIKRYWDVREAKGKYDYNLSNEALEQKFRDLLADSIRLRFRSDVPVGVYLSSGLDSNALLYYGRKVTNSEVSAFSMCSPHKEFNECSLIEPLLDPKQKQKWYTSILDPKEIPILAEQMNRIQDQPFGGLPTIAYGKLNECAKEHNVTVLLQGEAMDELLGGYRYYRSEFVRDLWQQRHYLKFLRYIKRQYKGTLLENAREAFGDVLAQPLLQSQDRTIEIDQSVLNPDIVMPPVSFERPFDSNLQNAQYRDLVHTKLPRVLRFNDQASMAYGREVRMPYLDQRIVEFSFWLPAHLKISYSSQKVLLRRAFRDILPPSVRDTEKRAFGAWQTAWFRNYGKEYVEGIINSTSFKNRPYWNHGALKKKIDAFFAGEGNNSFFLWQCINLELWLREYIDNRQSIL